MGRKKKELDREEVRLVNLDTRTQEQKDRDRNGALLEFKWTVSRGRDSYGYNICSLYVDRMKVTSCNGGGYDMKGTCLGHYVAHEFSSELLSEDFAEKCRSGPDKVSNRDKEARGFYGLHFHDPCFNPGKAEVDGKTIEQMEKDGESLGLERYQAFYRESTRVPDALHFIPSIDGACGFSTVEKILHAVGYELEYIKEGIFKLRKKEGPGR